MNALDKMVDGHGTRIGRILIGLLFLVGGVGALIGFKGFATYTGSLLPLGTLMATIAIIFKVGGGLSLILGIRPRLGSYALILFTLLTILFIHVPSWMKAVNMEESQMQMTMALKNLAIIGGLLLVAKRSSSQTQDAHPQAS